MARTAELRHADEVARGNIAGLSHDIKFGRNPDIDLAASEDIWDQGGTRVYTDNGGAAMFISSSDNGDTQSVEIELLSIDDGDWNAETVTMTLVGQTKTAITTTSGDFPVRIHRVKNVGTTDFAGDVYVYEDDTVTLGVPDTADLIRAKALAGNNRTLMAMRSIPSGFVGLLSKLVGSITGPVPSATVDLKLWVRPFDGVFQVRGHLGGMDSIGKTFFERDYKDTPIEIQPKSDIRVEGISDANNVPVTAEFELKLVALSDAEIAAAAPSRTYTQKILDIADTNLLGYWVGDDTTSIATDESGNNRDGTHTGVTLGQPGIGDGRKSPKYDGLNDFTDFYSVSFDNAFDGTEGTISIWSKVDSLSDWSDAATRTIVNIQVDGSNRLVIRKSTVANRIEYFYIAGGVVEQINVTTSSVDYINCGITWSLSDGGSGEVKAYFGGEQTGTTQTGLGTWVGALASTGVVIGAANQVPSEVWDGTEAHLFVMDRPATSAEMKQFGRLTE